MTEAEWASEPAMRGRGSMLFGILLPQNDVTRCASRELRVSVLTMQDRHHSSLSRDIMGLSSPSYS